MNTINLTGLKVMATHGVNPIEKQQPQLFLVDVSMSVNFLPAARQDDLKQTVNYSRVADLAVQVVQDNCFDLIETLAFQVATQILNQFSLVDSVQVTVHKPQAPIKPEFTDVAVNIVLDRV